MRKRHYAITSLLILTMLFSGCLNQMRRQAPQVPDPNINGNHGQEQINQGQRTPQGQQMQQNQQGQQSPGNMAPNISATYEKAEFDYAIMNATTTARAGAYSSAPGIYTLTSGTRVRVIAKYDGYYVVYLPNNRAGFIPMTSARPLNTTAAPQSIPTVPSTAGTTPGTTGSAPGAGTASGNLSSEESTMLGLINQERSKAGLKPLSASTQLASIARLKSKDIADNNYFSHTSPTYGSPFDMLKRYGVSYLYAGENLAKNQTVQAAHQALMNSPGHRQNILSNTFTEVGIGVITDEGSTKVYTQMFIGR